MLGLLVALGFLVRLAWLRQWSMAVIPGIFVVTLLWLVLLPEYPTYQMTLDRSAHSLTLRATRKGKLVSSFQVSTAELSSADMQFNRGARTIVLVRRDGSLLYPLGEQQLQDEPDQ